MSVQNENFRILAVSPTLIQVEVIDGDKFKGEQQGFAIGSYLKISDDSNNCILAIVQSYRIRDLNSFADIEREVTPFSFIIDAQPIGYFDDNEKFKRGGQQIAIPPQGVEIANSEMLNRIYDCIEDDKKFLFSHLAIDPSIPTPVDGDKFFSKHIAVVGSTGSGKSGTVAKILQEGIRQSDTQATGGALNNTHIILFDLHGEYSDAFPGSEVLNVDNLILPYWLMNSEELEEMFIESNEANSHNQVSQFKTAVTLNKKRYNTTLPKVNYDTPVYFSLDEVYRYLSNHNIATKDAKSGELKIKEKITGVLDEHQMFERIEFEDKAREKINGGPYAGEFDRFVPRLETKINDDRLAFLLRATKDGTAPFVTADLADILRQFIGYRDGGETNITIIDLSGIPFEVLSVVVSLISRLIFDFCFYYKSNKTLNRDLPFLIVLEEAHNYIPQSEGAKYKSVKKSLERVAKEGRKYGLSLMIVSQRPSEISETIFSQCNNFVAMRLTNPSDQNYVKRLLPDIVSTITDALPVLERQEALIIGDSIPIPSIVRIHDLVNKPNSHDIHFRTEWKKDWLDVVFNELVKKMKKEP